MKKLHLFLFLVFLQSSSIASPMLMPLGDSITYGNNGGNDYNHMGYRATLQDQLGIGVYNFVGSYKQPSSDPVYDVDNDGVNGQSSAAIVGYISAHLTANMTGAEKGSIVLLHIGTNDVQNNIDPLTIVGNVLSIIDAINSFNSDIAVYVALIIPKDNTKGGNNTAIQAYNLYLQKALSIKQISKSNLYIVDMYGAFTSTNDFHDLMYDRDHPNRLGYDLMAATWANAIKMNSLTQWNLTLGEGVFSDVSIN